MTRIHDILELCLNELDHGVEIETLLIRYPDVADELRPILIASNRAREMAVREPSNEIVSRNRMKVLHGISTHGNIKRKSGLLSWYGSLRPLSVGMTLVLLLFISGTNLVRASSTSIPGDSLYPVKRTWEDLSLFFTFDPERHEALEFEHENERLDELNELFLEGRAAQADFSGLVTKISETEITVSGIKVVIIPTSKLPSENIVVGDLVRVWGQVQQGRYLIADRIEILPPGSIVSEDDGDEDELDDMIENGSNNASKGDTVGESQGNTSGDESNGSGFESSVELVVVRGIATVLDDYFISVNGLIVDIRLAEVRGRPNIGGSVVVEGFYSLSGVFIATKIEYQSNGSDGNGSDGDSNDDESKIENNSNEDGNSNSNENSNDNNNDNLNTNSNDNDSEHSGTS